MAAPTIPSNNKKVEPTLADLLQLQKKDILLSLNCHHIATITEFDSSAQTVKCQINYKKTFFEQGADGTQRVVLRDYPPLIDVPVIVLGGGPFRITFPIAAGDTCLLLFNDRDMDNWFSGSNGGPVASGRLHSISDAIALVGLNSKASPVPNYDDTRAGISNGETMVMIGEELVKIANAGTTLNTLLQQLIVNIQALVTQTALITVSGVTTGPGASGVPVNAATITAISTQLTTTANNIAGLLE